MDLTSRPHYRLNSKPSGISARAGTEEMTSQTTRPRALTIVGPGKAGRSLHGAARSAGIEVDLLDRAAFSSAEPARLNGRIVLLAVPDGEIASACGALCAVGPEDVAIGHLSGATPLSALGEAERMGSPVFSMHPLQTFADERSSPHGAYCAVTAGDPETAEEVSRLAITLGMRPFPLDEDSRALYHAAASMASNFLVTLEETAAALLAAGGIADGREILTPLVAQTLANWSADGECALTGPIARGDEITVERHVQAIEGHAPAFRDVYLALAERTRQMAKESAKPDREPVEV